MAFSCLMGLQTLMKENPAFTFSIVSCIFVVLFFSCLNRNVDWPLLGMLPALLMNFHRLHDYFNFTLLEAGGTFRFKGPWFSGMEILATCDPVNMNHILKLRFSNYPKGEGFREIFDVLGDGIFAVDGELWRRQRRIARDLTNDPRFQAFTASCTRDKVERELIPLLNQMAELGEAFDLQPVLLKLTYDTTCTLVFGFDLGLHFNNVAKAMHDGGYAILLRHVVPKVCWKLLRWLRLGPEKKLAIAWEEIDRFFAQIITARREKKGQMTSHAVDLLTSYMNYPLEDEYGLLPSDNFLRDTLLSFLTAGKDSSGSALLWFIWAVSENPNVEEKILQELKHTNLSAEEIGKLVYLHAALCETMRLYPSLPLNHKAPLQLDVLPSGHKVHEGTMVVLSYYSMGRMEAIWGPDCLEFKPERWLSEEGKLSQEQYRKLHAFNIGPRACLGKDATFTQTKIAAAAMIYNFQFQVVENHVVEPKLSLVLQMKNGLMVKVNKRKHVGCDPTPSDGEVR